MLLKSEMLNEIARKNMQNMKSQDPDMYQDGCDFITYSVVFGYIRTNISLFPGLSSWFSHEAEEVWLISSERWLDLLREHKRPDFISTSSGTNAEVGMKEGESTLRGEAS